MPVTFREATLDNGLKIIAEVDDDMHSAAAGFFVRTGARDEPGELMGVSHFLEHMMFKGTEELNAELINQGFDAMGARNNAYTSNEVTCFHAHVLPEFLPRAVDLLAKMMRPALRQADFDTEKSVILEEIAMYKDNPFWVLYEECVDRHYRPHPLAHRVLGTEETVGAMTRDQMDAYFRARYSADNTVLSLAGRLDFDRVVDQANALCGSWQRTGAARDETPPPTAGERFELRDESVSRGYVIAIMSGPGVRDERRYAASMLAHVLGSPDNSRLHWALIETGLAEEAQAAFDPHAGVGDYFVYASGDPARLDEIWAACEREIAQLPDTLTEEDLERVRNKIATAATLSGERPNDRMQRLGRLWTATGGYRTLEQELARIQAVTLDDIRRLCAEFPLDRPTLGRLLPEDAA